MGHQLVATRPMEVIALDFLEIQVNRRNGFKYVLLIVDKLTRVCVCVPTRNATAATAARILCERWLAFFPEPAFVITDGGPHFSANLFREIATIRGFSHHITTPYSQWANGGVERMNKHFVRRLTALLNSRGCAWSEWPAWVPAIQEVMNKRLCVVSRGGVTPMQLLMGQEPRQALNYVAWMGVEADIRDFADPAQIEAALQGIHNELPLLWERAVQAQRHKRNQRRMRPGLTIPRINLGDLVLVA